MQVGPFKQHVMPLLLESSPPVLSVGKRCMEEGYSFHWPSGRNPYLVSPDGKRHDLDVDNMVPYLPDPPFDGVSCPAPAFPVGVAPSAVEEVVGDQGPPEEGGVIPGQDQPVAEGDDGADPGEEIGVEPGSEIRDLKAEAISVSHLMTHFPKNPHCTACQRAKMTTAPARKTYRPEPDPQVFGENVTADHVIIIESDEGVDGERAALVIIDRGNGWIDCYPVADKTAEECPRSWRFRRTDRGGC